MSRHDRRWNRRWTVASAAAAVGVVIAGTAWGLGAGAEPAAANGTDGQFCVPEQVTATMVRETWNPGLRAPQSKGAIQIQARPDEGCHIAGAPEATLQGAATPVVTDDPTPQRVLVTDDEPAWIPLSWADEASPSAQETPRSITISLNGYPIVVPWTGGGVDAVAPADPVVVHGVQSGLAPYHFPG